MCIKGLRLVTMQLPEKFSPIRLGTNRSSHIRVSRKFTKKLALMLLVDTEPEEAVRCGIVSPRLPD
jgi:hypothetical protein